MDNNNENLNQKECIFSLAKINKYFLFPFLVPIICTMANYIIILGNFENNAPKINFTFLIIYLFYFGIHFRRFIIFCFIYKNPSRESKAKSNDTSTKK